MDTVYTLSRTDAHTRSTHLNVTDIDVDIDISAAGNSNNHVFPVTSTLHVSTTADTTFIDIAGTVTTVEINGQDWYFEHHGPQLFLYELPTNTPLIITVHAICEYSRTGEGLHRYLDPEDERYYLYTQFEPTDAHRAWPCFDQPDIKPRWTFHITAPRNWIVTSNGTVNTKEHTEDTTTWHFTQTPPLSSYITALVAGEYAVVESTPWEASDATKELCPQTHDLTIPLRLMCRQSLAPHMDVDDIFEVTRQGLDYFHQRYRIAYPWGSYDQIYVPEYNLGAMENPGCVTFNERMLSRDTPTFAQRQSRANVILHEMCHMWFGDLATPAWWDDLWLKESFADNQGTMAAAQATRYTGEWASFAIERKAWAYQQDLYPTTHPICADIPDVAAAKTNFDGITYAKGAAVLKQLVAWVGEEAFFRAAYRYFDAHAFSATSLRDLLVALESETGQDLSQWEQVWLHTTGPSELRVSWTEGANNSVEHLWVHQDPDVSTLRPHQLMLSVFSLEAAGVKGQELSTGQEVLVHQHYFPVRLDGPSVEVDIRGVLDAPGCASKMDLLVLNDEDLTYAVTRFDARSTQAALKAVSSLEDTTTRAVVWSTLWLAVRDGLLSANNYVEAVLRHAPDESDDAVLNRLLSSVDVAIGQYTPLRLRAALRHSCLRKCMELLAGSLSEDRRREWAGLAISCVRGLPRVDAESTQWLRLIATGSAAGVPSTQTMRWAAWTALAGHGVVSEQELASALASAHTGEAEVFHRRAWSALPSGEVRDVAWREICQQDVSNDVLSATLEGLQLSSWEGNELQERFFDEVEGFWRSHTIGMGIRFVRAGFPSAVDVETPALSTQLVAMTDAWLETHQGAPQALRRLIIERRDDVRRALHAQARVVAEAGL